MKRIISLAAVAGFLVGGRAAAAQSDELAQLRAELLKQQQIIATLLKRVEELEHKQRDGVTREEFTQEVQTQTDSITSLRDTILGRVGLNGYYNFRFFNDGSPTVSAFQQHHLGVLMGKQLGRFNFFMELELQNVPHHRPVVQAGEEVEGEAHAEGEEARTTPGEDVSGEGQVAVENAWMEYNHGRYFNIRVGKQLSPQYWWQNHYPNLTLSTTLPIYLRELFPPELVGVMVYGTATRPVGTSEFAVTYKLYAANNQVEGSELADRRDGKAWGGRVQVRLPAAGALRRLDVAADIYRGHVSLTDETLVDDRVWGVEGQLEIDRFLLQTEYAQGRSEGSTRLGYYIQPAVRLHEDWVTFYRAERLESPRLQQAELRHLVGVNFRPFPQIAFKAEYYRALPRVRSFIPHADERRPYNGIATGAVFFF